MVKFRTTVATDGRSTCLTASLFPSLWGGDSSDLESSTRSPLVTDTFLLTSWVREYGFIQLRGLQPFVLFVFLSRTLSVESLSWHDLDFWFIQHAENGGTTETWGQCGENQGKDKQRITWAGISIYCLDKLISMETFASCCYQSRKLLSCSYRYFSDLQPP